MPIARRVRRYVLKPFWHVGADSCDMETARIEGFVFSQSTDEHPNEEPGAGFLEEDDLGARRQDAFVAVVGEIARRSVSSVDFDSQDLEKAWSLVAWAAAHGVRPVKKNASTVNSSESATGPCFAAGSASSSDLIRSSTVHGRHRPADTSVLNSRQPRHSMLDRRHFFVSLVRFRRANQNRVELQSLTGRILDA